MWRSASRSAIQDHSDHGGSKEPMNPFSLWIYHLSDLESLILIQITPKECSLKRCSAVLYPFLIIPMKKLLGSDWLRAVQFKCNTSAN